MHAPRTPLKFPWGSLRTADPSPAVKRVLDLNQNQRPSSPTPALHTPDATNADEPDRPIGHPTGIPGQDAAMQPRGARRLIGSNGPPRPAQAPPSAGH